jgi:hypothetical protein
MPSTPRITGLIDSELGDWRAQVYGLVNPPVTAIYATVQVSSNWWYSKAFGAGANSVTYFVGPWPDQVTALNMMNIAKTRDGF